MISQAIRAPALPVRPNRIAILLLTIVLALTLGVGTIAVAEVADNTISSSHDLVQLLEIPPLAFIPLIANDADISARKRRRAMAFAAVSVWLVVTLFFILKPAMLA